jgi:hypothetical protein
MQLKATRTVCHVYPTSAPSAVLRTARYGTGCNLACGAADVGQRLYLLRYDATEVTYQLSNTQRNAEGNAM